MTHKLAKHLSHRRLAPVADSAKQQLLRAKQCRKDTRSLIMHQRTILFALGTLVRLNSTRW